MDINNLTQEYKDIYNKLIMKVDTDIDINSVIMTEENKKKIQEFIQEYSYRDKFITHGLQPMNRLLFYGASGTGKTYLSKALANHLGFTMLYVDIANSLSAGSVSINISNIFKLANEIGSCLIMFDECDSIAWNRGSGDSENGDVRRATNSVFQHLDQMRSSNILIGATNLLFKMDPAFERRFSMKVEFRRPELGLKEIIKKFIFKQFNLIDDVDNTTKDIVERRTKLSYYEIQGIVERAMKRAIMADTKNIKTSDIYNDFAVSMKIKIHFKTDADNAEIFQSSIK